MKRGGIGGLVLIFVLASWAGSYTFLDLATGSRVSNGPARCVGMGEVALISCDGALGIAMNPAAIGVLGRPEIALSYSFFSGEDDWAFPMHDSFDALLGYSTYSTNSAIYHDVGVGLSTGRLSRSLGASAAVALVPVYDFRYTFREEIRDRNSSSVPSDRVIANDFVEADGGLRAMATGLALGSRDKVRLGVALDYLFGDYEVAARIAWADPAKIPWEGAGPETSSTISAQDLSGVRVRLGGTIRVTPRVMVAAWFQSSCDLEGDMAPVYDRGLFSFLPVKEGEGTEYRLKYPASYALGVSFRPRNELATLIEGNVVFTEWSEFENWLMDDLDLEDTYEWHLGVEHIFYNQRPLRLGFLYSPSPREHETAEAAVTAGSGLNVSGFEIDFSAKVGWREYRSPDLFDDGIFGAKSRVSTDQVRETNLGGTVSVTKRF